MQHRGPRGLGFAICTACGYSDRERETGEGRQALPSGFETHAPLWTHRANARCWKPNSAPVLRNRALGAETDTDVLQIEVETMLTKFHSLADSELISRSLGHALRIAGAALLEVDTREVSFAGARVGNGGWG